MVKKVLSYLIGLVIMSFGTVLLINAGIGLSAFDALCVGLGNLTVLSTGNCCMILGIIIIFINAIIEKKLPNIFSFITSIVIGSCIDFWTSILNLEISNWKYITICFLVGFLINAFGIALYVSANLVRGPIDQLMMNISELVGDRVWLAKTIMEVFFLIVALCVKGPIGLGTIILTFGSGVAIDKYILLLKGKVKS